MTPRPKEQCGWRRRLLRESLCRRARGGHAGESRPSGSFPSGSRAGGGRAGGGRTRGVVERGGGGGGVRGFPRGGGRGRCVGGGDEASADEAFRAAADPEAGEEGPVRVSFKMESKEAGGTGTRGGGSPEGTFAFRGPAGAPARQLIAICRGSGDCPGMTCRTVQRAQMA